MVLIALAIEESCLRAWVRAGGVAGALAVTVLAADLLWASIGGMPRLSADFAPVLFAFALPALAAALLAAGWWWRHGSAWPASIMALAASALIVGCLWSAGPRVAANRSSERIARALATRLAPGDEVYAYHCYPQTLPVYRRLVGVVSSRGSWSSASASWRRQSGSGAFPAPSSSGRSGAPAGPSWSSRRGISRA